MMLNSARGVDSRAGRRLCLPAWVAAASIGEAPGQTEGRAGRRSPLWRFESPSKYRPTARRLCSIKSWHRLAYL